MWAWGPQLCPQCSANAALTCSHNTPGSTPSACKAGDFNQIWPKYSCCTLPALWATQTRCYGFQVACLGTEVGGWWEAAGEEGLPAEPKRWGCWEPSWLFSSYGSSATASPVLGLHCVGVLVCGFYQESERLSKLLVYLCWIPFGLFLLLCCCFCDTPGVVSFSVVVPCKSTLILWFHPCRMETLVVLCYWRVSIFTRWDWRIKDVYLGLRACDMRIKLIKENNY